MSLEHFPRRRVLVALAALPFAGCSNVVQDGDSPATTDTHSQTASTPTETPTETAETDTPTNTPADTPTPTQVRYDLGEWHAYDDWRLTVDEVGFQTSYTIDGETYQMPDDETLAVATVSLENNGPQRSWSNQRFAVVTGDGVHQSWFGDVPRRVFENPRALDGVEHNQQHMPEGYPLDQGEAGRIWIVSVVPRSTSREELQVAFDDGYDEAWPVRWTPSGGT